MRFRKHSGKGYDDEDRAAFLDCFLRTNKPSWTALTPAEWDQIWRHVTTCDFPETAAVWCELGREAGFAQARQVFVDPTDFFRLFRFEGSPQCRERAATVVACNSGRIGRNDTHSIV